LLRGLIHSEVLSSAIQALGKSPVVVTGAKDPVGGVAQGPLVQSVTGGADTSVQLPSVPPGVTCVVQVALVKPVPQTAKLMEAEAMPLANTKKAKIKNNRSVRER
jgi:hypothetical protein